MLIEAYTPTPEPLRLTGRRRPSWQENHLVMLAFFDEETAFEEMDSADDEVV